MSEACRYTESGVQLQSLADTGEDYLDPTLLDWPTPGLSVVSGCVELQSTPDEVGLDKEYSGSNATERRLTEVDNLNRWRNPDGSHSEMALRSIHENLVPFVQEMAMELAITPTYMRYENGHFWWGDQTAFEVAKSGLKYHVAPAARKRVAVEMDEACDVDENLVPGMVKIFGSPRMPEQDAPHEVAKSEHLADDDAIRIQYLHQADDGTVLGKVTESILIRDIPLQAWVDWLQDPDNIFGKFIPVEDPGSALSVMKAHREMHVPIEALPEGVLSVVSNLLPYVDTDNQPAVARRLAEFRTANQGDLLQKAENIADRWLRFEMDLADSLREGYANKGIFDFIHSLAEQWPKEVVDMLEANNEGLGRIRMTRELASLLEAGRQNTLLVAAAVITGNKAVLEQLDEDAAQQIYEQEMALQEASEQGMSVEELQALEIGNMQFIAEQHIKVGGGCGGDNSAFGEKDGERTAKGEDQSTWKTKRGVCVVASCRSRPREVTVGPCGVCILLCQDKYNNGKDPTKNSRLTPSMADLLERRKAAKPVVERGWLTAA